jgi:hypothetical protein
MAETFLSPSKTGTTKKKREEKHGKSREARFKQAFQRVHAVLTSAHT